MHHMDSQLVLTIWFAGFYEGEGSVSNDKGNNNRIRLSISQNDETPLLKGKEIWGGAVRKRVRKSPASELICYGNEWSLFHNQALKFIEDIKPYMLIPYKIGQIERVLAASKEGYDRKFKCNFCDKEYANPAGRLRHEKKEHTSKGVLFTCDVEPCERTFKSRDSVNRHKRLNHATVSSTSEAADDVESLY